MKNLLIILSTLLLLGCKDDDENSSNPAQLPPATQTGKNTAGCLVNGKVLLPRGQAIDGPPILTSHYQYLDGGYHFGLGINDNITKGFPGIFIGSHNISFEEGHTYQFSENLWDDTQIFSTASYVNFDVGHFLTKGDYTGELKITHLDTINYIISGTFWFDAVDDISGKKVEVREGRFDLHYAP
ncbi:MAG: hypothetical protein LBE36_09270 [Flavobacteriaceae bacterium]|jgi:hypothetical protein|nr:hypothetical protein [Flavobacteriaceae bacterium]